jgi:hypothetical protein
VIFEKKFAQVRKKPESDLDPFCKLEKLKEEKMKRTSASGRILPVESIQIRIASF